MNRVRNILPWLGIALYLVTMLSFISVTRKKILCNDIKVTIADNTSNFFIEDKDVLSLLSDKGQTILNTPIEDIDVNGLEELLTLHPSIKKANVYRNLSGVLEIEVSQRNPIMRVVNSNQESYYIDELGTIMPLSSKYSSHVLVASGNINESFAKWSKVSLKEKNAEITPKPETLLFDLFLLADFIYHDKFWNAQIEQVYVNGNDIELIPRVGTQLILIGGIENYKEKFKKLRALYEQGMPQTGWNKYKLINLKYNNQVICTKR